MKRIIKYILRAALILYLIYGLILVAVHYESITYMQSVSMSGFDSVAVILGLGTVFILMGAIPVLIVGLIFQFIGWIFKNE